MIPFTRQEFFEVFAAYNTSVWPAQLGLYVLAAVLVALAFGGKRQGEGRIPLGLAVLWIWTGAAYHWWHFAAINRPAWLFGALFIIEGVLLAVAGRRGILAIGRPSDWQGWTGGALLVYTLVVYPLLGLAGHPPEEVPVLGVPCPTTIFTLGLLFWAVRPLPRHLLVIPLLWALIGSTAVLLLGVVQDLGLLISGLLGLLLLRSGGKKVWSAGGTVPGSFSAAEGWETSNSN